MRRFVVGWKTLGHEQRLDAHIVNYADDFVICCRPRRAAEALSVTRRMIESIKLTMNEKKTRLCSLPNETFKFLGFEFGAQVSWKTGRRYLTPTPAKSKVQAICDKISGITSARTTWRSLEEEVCELNQVLFGWGNYFRLGYVTGAWRIVPQHACRRFRQWMHRKTNTRRGGPQNPPDLRLYEEYGLLNLVQSIRRKPLWANTR